MKLAEKLFSVFKCGGGTTVHHRSYSWMPMFNGIIDKDLA